MFLLLGDDDGDDDNNNNNNCRKCRKIFRLLACCVRLASADG